MDWVGNARHNVALPYNHWMPAEWHSAFDKLGLTVSFCKANLKLYPFPVDLIFGTSLHFIAALGKLGQKANSDGAVQQLDR
jgi:hypothetical protein